jgi:hypothetical protein
MSHHKYGPSSLKWREICPGWDNEPQPTEGGSVAALEGTMMHKALETGNYTDLVQYLADCGVTQTPDGVDYADPKVNIVQLESEVFDI